MQNYSLQGHEASEHDDNYLTQNQIDFARAINFQDKKWIFPSENYRNNGNYYPKSVLFLIK